MNRCHELKDLKLSGCREKRGSYVENLRVCIDQSKPHLRK